MGFVKIPIVGGIIPGNKYMTYPDGQKGRGATEPTEKQLEEFRDMHGSNVTPNKDQLEAMVKELRKGFEPKNKPTHRGTGSRN